MKVYLVIKEGVYIRGIAGVYSSIEAAKVGQVQAYSLEDDTYHDFYIYEHETDPVVVYTGYCAGVSSEFMVESDTEGVEKAKAALKQLKAYQKPSPTLHYKDVGELD